MPTDQTDMARLITDNMGKLRAYSRKVGKHNHEDVFQDACRTIMSSSTYDPERPPGPWLYLHVKSAGVSFLRFENKGVGLDIDDIDPESEDSLSVDGGQENSAELMLFRRNIQRLPERQRQVCEYVANDNTLKGAADAMGISKQAAHLYFGRARKALGIAA